MKLQLNSLEALTRLIGGDTEIEIELRNSIAQKFADKYLKGLANEEVLSATAADIKKQVEKTKGDILAAIQGEFVKAIGSYPRNQWGGSGDFVLNADAKAKIKREIEVSMDEIIRKIIREEIAQIDIKSMIKNSLNSSLIWNVRQQVGEEVKKALETK